MLNYLEGELEMKKTVSVIFEESQLDKLTTDGKKHGRLLSSHIRYIVTKYLENLEIEEKDNAKND